MFEYSYHLDNPYYYYSNQHIFISTICLDVDVYKYKLFVLQKYYIALLFSKGLLEFVFCL